MYTLLPSSRKGVLVFDLDMLALADIYPLWNQLRSFRRHQVYGLAPELQPLPPTNLTGLNGGLQLHHLENLRVMHGTRDPRVNISSLLRSSSFRVPLWSLLHCCLQQIPRHFSPSSMPMEPTALHVSLHFLVLRLVCGCLAVVC
eukprot:NODE_3355_length_783_cov_60.107629_g2804_i0.p1 GENE.NODE_3355_length_783_cov_60.107629_g2804_i0~~NODE_3355_length_783_cov_60.107629_g2804_i0.p1  ORF type:complete len:144 (-),score=7.14 NODE_3355_length_783_cov_60.107629_g2804_i0:143-574(-)